MMVDGKIVTFNISILYMKRHQIGLKSMHADHNYAKLSDHIHTIEASRDQIMHILLVRQVAKD